MEKSRPQLSLAELFQLRWLLGGVLGLLSAWTLFYMEVDALLALALLTVTVPVFTIWPHLSRALPSFIHRLAFPLIVTIFALDWWENREPLPAMIRLDLMLLGYRCIAPRGRREDLQLILLALFVVVVTGVFTVSPAFVVQILFFTGAALGLLLAVTLSDARAGGSATAAAPGWERVRWRELFARVRAVADLRVVGLGAALFSGVVGLSVVLFLALPRVELSNDFFLDKLISKKSRTGFSEDVRFGEVVDISEDGGTAFSVDVSDVSAVPAEPYWRMLVLDEYSGEGFRMSRGLRESLSRPNREKSHVHGGVGRSSEDRTVWTVYYQPGVSRYLPLMGGFSRLSFGEAQSLSQSAALRIAALQNEPSKMLAYRIEGMDTGGILRDRRFAVEKKVAPSDRRWRRGIYETDAVGNPVFFGEEDGGDADPTFLELASLREEDRARLAAWVAEIGGPGAGGGDFARRAGAWLQARHDYSMKSVLPKGDSDPLVRWIGSTQPGHCELFAGGMVVLARAAGVQARLVTGFKGGVWNETSGHISVKNSDAHAWTEIWEDSLGAWLRVDATPGSQITPSAASQATDGGGASRLQRDRGWGARMDSLQVFWYRRIVNFDQNSQVEMLRGAKDQLSATLKSLREQVEGWLRAILDWLRQPWDFSRLAGVALVMGAGSGLVVIWHRFGRAWWMAWRSRRASTHQKDPVRREASRWLARLDRVAPPQEQWVPGAASAREQVAAARARLLRLRFGAREGWSAPAEVFRLAKLARRAVRKAPR